jgi:Replication-relaxation
MMEKDKKQALGNEENPQSGKVRRRRYERASSVGCVLTPRKQAILLHLVKYRLLLLPQLALLEGLDTKALRKHVRPLFDAGLIHVVGIPRVLLADTDDPNDPTLLYGSAPNIYQPTKEGVRLLWELGQVDRATRDKVIPEYGPKNAYFLVHEVQIRDVRVWLAQRESESAQRESESAQRESEDERGSDGENITGGGEAIAWKDGSEAYFDLSTVQDSPVRSVRPDAWFGYRFASGQVMVSLVEIDRGTERGGNRWKEKMVQYGSLFGTGRSVIKATTGFEAARVLVVVPTVARREWLAQFIAEEAPSDFVRERFWVVVRRDLLEATFFDAVWQRPGKDGLHPLLPSVTPK